MLEGNYSSNQVSHTELIFAIAKILNVSEQKILDNIGLFSNIDPRIKNVFHYLARMENEQELISASHAMELLSNFHTTID